MLLGLLLGWIPQDVSALRLPALVGDHMVLQRDAQVRIWGWAKPGVPVMVEASWSPQAMMSGADAKGRWEVRFATPADQPGPHQITIQDGAASLTVSDVLLGEVWVCGGQSNMEWTLGPGVGNGVIGGAEAAAAADWPDLRWFDVPNEVAMAPAEDCGGAWQRCTPQTAPRMSAIGFFFGAALRRELPGVPIGLIGCNWGGTVAEAWMSEEMLADHGGFDAELARLRTARAEGADIAASLAQLQRAWWDALDAKDEGSRALWNRADFDDSAWGEATLPGAWSGALAEHDGVVWYRKTVTIPAEWVQRDLVVELGPIDDCDTFWADGERWGATHEDGAWQTPRQYRIAAKMVNDTELVLALRVTDTGGAGGLIGAPEAMRIYRQNHPEHAVPLAGAWQTMRGASLAELGAFPRRSWLHANFPAALHHGMLAPISRFAIRGAIFYQGESNVGRWEQYRSLFPAMVRSWRAAWGQGEFPFYWVQIAPYAYGAGEKLARLREAQTMALAAIPHGGMAVTMDVGDPRDIHPLEKRVVGERLARWALAGPYGRKDLEVSGPLLRSAEPRGAEMILHFDHAAGLQALGGAELAHFTLAGADKVFHPAEARIEGATVVLRCAAVSAPVAARYCWGETDAGSLANGAGLPAPSFRTDDWPERN
jgi:sialate O-acetylesterase